MEKMTDLYLQDFNPLSKHVKYAQKPNDEESNENKNQKLPTMKHQKTN